MYVCVCDLYLCVSELYVCMYVCVCLTCICVCVTSVAVSRRHPSVRQLVLERRGRRGIRVPPRAALHLGDQRAGRRRHRPQGGAQLPV